MSNHRQRDQLYLLSKERLITVLACEKLANAWARLRTQRATQAFALMKHHAGKGEAGIIVENRGEAE
jgi:hypothetical protein